MTSLHVTQCTGVFVLWFNKSQWSTRQQCGIVPHLFEFVSSSMDACGRVYQNECALIWPLLVTQTLNPSRAQMMSCFALHQQALIASREWKREVGEAAKLRVATTSVGELACTGRVFIIQILLGFSSCRFDAIFSRGFIVQESTSDVAFLVEIVFFLFMFNIYFVVGFVLRKVSHHRADGCC